MEPHKVADRRIMAAIEAAGVTNVAEKIGASRAAVSMFKAGRMAVSIDLANRILAAVGCGGVKQ